MDLQKVIHNDNFTDENGELHYLNTGRDNVSGLSFPNHYIRNDENYSYTRILNIKLSPDTSLIYPIHECFLLTTFKNDNTCTTNIVNIDAIVKNSTIEPTNINITCNPLTIDGILDIKAALKSVFTNGDMSVELGIWLNSEDIIDINVKELNTLSFNEIPNNISKQFLQCDYETYYLNNEDVMHEVNMFILEESIGTKIKDSIYINKEISEKVKNIDNLTKSIVPDYRFVSVLYDDLYKISDTNVDEIINPVSVQYTEVTDSFIDLKSNYISVKEKGNYIIALKVNMEIHEGNSTKMMVSLFKNDDRIEETVSSVYLDPSNKIYPIGFLAGQFKIQLNSSDKLYLKARWTNKDNVNIENHCTIQIIKLNSVE